MDNPRVHIVEGVPGAGKDTLAEQIFERHHPERNPVHRFSEDGVLSSWKHVYLPDIDTLRLHVLMSLAKYASEELDKSPDSVFIFNRFHLTFAVLNRTPGLEVEYSRLLESLRRLPVLVSVAVIEEHEIAARAIHAERLSRECAWALFLKRRLEEVRFDTVAQFYAAQQARIKELVQEQGLPYEFVRIEPQTEM